MIFSQVWTFTFPASALGVVVQSEGVPWSSRVHCTYSTLEFTLSNMHTFLKSWSRIALKLLAEYISPSNTGNWIPVAVGFFGDLRTPLTGTPYDQKFCFCCCCCCCFNSHSRICWLILESKEEREGERNIYMRNIGWLLPTDSYTHPHWESNPQAGIQYDVSTNWDTWPAMINNFRENNPSNHPSALCKTLVILSNIIGTKSERKSWSPALHKLQNPKIPAVYNHKHQALW